MKGWRGHKQAEMKGMILTDGLYSQAKERSTRGKQANALEKHQCCQCAAESRAKLVFLNLSFFLWDC
jgi:hypothetical protein